MIELKRPDCGNLKKDTVNGILKINSGELSGEQKLLNIKSSKFIRSKMIIILGQLAFFPRHCLHLFGNNMHKANLMDVVQLREEYNVELVGGTNNKSVPYSVRAAWIGSRPSTVNKDSSSINENPIFKSWLTR